MPEEAAASVPTPASSKQWVWILGVGVLVAALLVAFFVVSVLPKFREMDYKGHVEGNYTANLNAIRSAIYLYQSDNEGVFPKDLGSEVFGKYMDAIPYLDLRFYGLERSNKVEVYAIPKDWYNHPEKLKDTGHWGYDPAQGLIIIDSRKLNPAGVPICHFGYE